MEGCRMSVFVETLVIAALLGCGVIAGVFFAFSSFIMKSLARLPSSDGIAAMQSINVVVLNRSFLGTFMGTAVISFLLIVLSVVQWGTASAPFFLLGAVSYLVGTFLVTVIGNVPLNNRLQAVSGSDASAFPVWEHYLDRWTLLNTLRTLGAVAAALMFTLGLTGGAHV
jgi:uncharacterized membrane protein